MNHDKIQGMKKKFRIIENFVLAENITTNLLYI